MEKFCQVNNIWMCGKNNSIVPFSEMKSVDITASWLVIFKSKYVNWIFSASKKYTE